MQFFSLQIVLKWLVELFFFLLLSKKNSERNCFILIFSFAILGVKQCFVYFHRTPEQNYRLKHNNNIEIRNRNRNRNGRKNTHPKKEQRDRAFECCVYFNDICNNSNSRRKHRLKYCVSCRCRQHCIQCFYIDLCVCFEKGNVCTMYAMLPKREM